MKRQAIAIRGTVQGVGFRPFVYRLASSLELGGFVRNQTGGVTIEVEGDEQSLDAFVSKLLRSPPPLSRIETWSRTDLSLRGESGFHIEHSDPGAVRAVRVTPDAATCDDCLAELFDPRDRRYRYPFLNCTNCGPRLTIVTGVPYDRALTTMARFQMCARCRAEYDDPSDRRFHAQPTACADCGPRLAVADQHGQSIQGADPLAVFVEALRCGKIGVMKGLGGYHLVCDARNAEAVAELRRRKHRYEKPFAVMVSGSCQLPVASGQRKTLLGADGQCSDLLASPRRPIVLVPRQLLEGIADAVAPGNPLLGIMLPYTPLHHLLLHDMQGAPLVMTSGNQTDEPIAYEDDDALARLGSIADIFLTHDRPIHLRCDDSVTRTIGTKESPIRRSRGYAPQPVALPLVCPMPILAVGGQLKSTFALASDNRAILSHHLGDLDHYQAYRAFERDVAHYERLFEIRPAVIAHDMHPDYASTEYARRREAATGVRRVEVQHHHAHMASCMAEHGLAGPVIGVTLDGSGFGTDGAIWGGEFLVGGYDRFARAAHFRYVAMPGGEQAVREPWRMAAAHLHDAGVACAPFEQRIGSEKLRTVRRMIERRLNSPLTSSAGRLFDAVASLAGVRDRVTYEGQAAIELEWLAAAVADGASYPFEVVPSRSEPSPGTPGESGEGAGEGQFPAQAPTLTLPRSTGGGDKTCAPDSSGTLAIPSPGTPGDRTFVIDTRSIISAVAADVASGVSKELIARRFHSTMVEIIAEACERIRMAWKLTDVVLSGGVFMNAMLTLETEARLTASGFVVYRHELVPSNDGGLSLGQAAVAAATIGRQ